MLQQLSSLQNGNRSTEHEGEAVGDTDGPDTLIVGGEVGNGVGWGVGDSEGNRVGFSIGERVGFTVGSADAGAHVTIQHVLPQNFLANTRNSCTS